MSSSYFLGIQTHSVDPDRAYPGSEFVVCQHFSQMEKKLEPNEIDFSQGFSQELVSIII